ncbi:response regulator transcription factor [Candidatus Sumerlaeota bacterium]|nr:response regulator transcription factor [Candidatus Sumerlaeota bacterium]
MIKILIADDHPIVREGIKQILAETDDMVVAGEAATSQEVLNKVLKEDFDVVLLDISMPGRSGLDVLKEIKFAKPKIQVLMLSIHPEEHYAERVIKAGASGYLTKESAPDELIGAIRKVSQGRKYISPSFAEKLASRLDTDTDKLPHERLSDREYQVMRMIASGKTVKEIAEEMALSIKTISTYRSRVLQKMGMKNNAELTYYVIKHNLVE